VYKPRGFSFVFRGIPHSRVFVRGEGKIRYELKTYELVGGPVNRNGVDDVHNYIHVLAWNAVVPDKTLRKAMMREQIANTYFHDFSAICSLVISLYQWTYFDRECLLGNIACNA
jgi:hypothetical protein